MRLLLLDSKKKTKEKSETNSLFLFSWKVSGWVWDGCEWMPRALHPGSGRPVTCVHQSIFIHHQSQSQDKKCWLDLASSSKASMNLKTPFYSTVIYLLSFSSLLIYKYWLPRQAGRNRRRRNRKRNAKPIDHLLNDSFSLASWGGPKLAG